MKLTPFVFILLLLGSSSAFSNGYIGFGVGSTNVKADLTSLGGGNIDERATLSKLYGGFRFQKHVSIEAAYFNLAEASVGQVGTGASAASGAVDMKALGVYGVAFIPFSKHSQGFIKAGVADWDANLRRNTTMASADGTDALYGLGVSYNFTKELIVTVDWEVIDSPNPEFSTFSLGFKWQFK